MSVDVDQIVVSKKFQEGEIVKSLCIILPQMSSYIKYFKNGGKNMSSLIKYDKMWEKYEQIWDAIKNKLSINFHSEPVYYKTYIKAKVREFDGKIKTNFLGNEAPKENMHYTCIAYITIDSVMRIDKKKHPQVYLEECKYRVKKIQTPRFINTELKSDSELDSEPDSEVQSKSDSELMAKLKSDSDSE